MRNGRKPNYKQKRLLTKNNKDWNDWLFIQTVVHKDDVESNKLRFRHKTTNEVIEL